MFLRFLLRNINLLKGIITSETFFGNLETKDKILLRFISKYKI
jgi:hypothetical protein